MILAELEIEDYKQFRGVHVVAPPPEGVIAVIGPNGAGKTTLFEAIEWCLYQPREIAADEVPTRGQAAKPRVKLTLQDPASGVRYVVERTLNKQRVASAEIYREDEPERRIVQGSRQVTDYVSRTLVGLGHRAFVSTFFTRQKELSFFGSLRETDRRREVGRLLGMETIREAQVLIGEERTGARNTATALELQHREATEGRDFNAELAEAEETLAAVTAALAAADAVLAAAATAHQGRRDALTAIQELERRDAALRAEIERIAGDLRAAAGRRESVEGELARLDAAAAERDGLLHLAGQRDARAAVVAGHDAAMERHGRAEQLRAAVEGARTGVTDAADEVQHTVYGISAPDLEGWTWSAADASAPVEAASRLIEIAGALDVERLAARSRALTQAAKFDSDRDTAEQLVQKFHGHMRLLLSERGTLLEGGDPRAVATRAAAERDEALATVEQANAREQTAREEIDRLKPTLDRLRAQREGTTCPTCGRPIEGDDIEIAVGLFESQIEGLTREIATLDRARNDASRRATGLAAKTDAANERARALANLAGRIQTGEQKIEEAETAAAAAKSSLAGHLAEHGFAAVPEHEAIEAATRELETTERVVRTLPLLQRLRTAAQRHLESAATNAAALETLGDVAYDPTAHDAARRALREAEAASAKVEQIDRDLARRPTAEANLAELRTQIAAMEREHGRREKERTALGFDPAALAAAQEAEQAALTAEREARDAQAAAARAHQEGLSHRDRIEAERQRVAKLAERADALRRDADQLEEMYREFNAFEQYVASRLTPQLSDHTGELLRAVTDGKYDAVHFNENYGIEIYDGTEEHFPIEEFSGGERDVVALCARLALSRLIGGQANNPPGFLVLDEVFGSLDRERRHQVLETLGALAGTADAFHQLFIISHVDDVRASPIFNEVWRVTEEADGISRIENLTVTGGFEEA